VEAGARRRLGIATISYDPSAIDDLIAQVDAGDLGEALGLALDDLPAEQRRAVVGRVALDTGYEDLAEALGATEEALRARVSRGLRAMRIRLPGGKL
jgi:DNA-directed RNA polymerase specialized sigma24 family protein